MKEIKKYAVTTPVRLRSLCIDNNWFTCGSNEQYSKLFYANENNFSLCYIVTIIWVCSDYNHSWSSIFSVLSDEHRKYLLALPEGEKQ